MMDDARGDALARTSSRAPFLSDERSVAAAAGTASPYSDGSGASSQSPLSRRRYAIGLLYGSGNALNAFLWICFAPVVNTTMARFDVDSNAVNMFSILFLALYLPGTILNIYLTERYGLRMNLVAGAGLNLLCAWVRYAGMQLAAPHAQYAIVMLGQILGAMAQPLFTNSPSRVAGTWFSVRERDLATVCISLANPIGNALGSLVPSIVVSTVDDLPWLMLYQAAAATIIFLLCAVLGRDEPEYPPNPAAASRVAEREKEREGAEASQRAGKQGQSAASRAWGHMVREAYLLLSNPNFCFLAVSFGIGLGLFNAILTVLAQLLSPCGYDDSTAGISGGALLGAGLVVSGIVGLVLEKTHAYAPMFKAGVVAVAACMVFMLASIRPGAEAQVTASFAVLGAALIPLLPVSLENAAECSFPVSEDTSAAVLMFTGQVTGIVYIFSVTALLGITPSSDCSSVVTPLAAFILGNMAVAVCAVCAFGKDYRRQRVEKGAGLLVVDQAGSRLVGAEGAATRAVGTGGV